MFAAVYIESAVRDHPRARAILDRYRHLPRIECERFGEIFNRKAQNFRLQKEHPALILARKHGRKVLPAPGGYGFEAGRSHYFSHMLNCVYDCRYCFLQGMYRSAHCVLFVNYEDFADSIQNTLAAKNTAGDIHASAAEITRAGGGGVGEWDTQSRASAAGEVFYSGYDCDSLALEPVSGFADYFVPFFANLPGAVLELRTKSTQISGLLRMEPTPNCIIAMSFTTADAARRWEHQVPSIAKRLAALRRLQDAGWPVALRFEPLLPTANPAEYEDLFDEVFSRIRGDRLHSVSTGLFRMPADYFRNTLKLYPDEALFARETRTENGVVFLKQPDGEAWLARLEASLFRHIDPSRYYRCAD